MAEESEHAGLPLYDDTGHLDLSRFTRDSRDVLEGCLAWLQSINRSTFLPIDLIVVLIQRDNHDLGRVIALAARGNEDVDGLAANLSVLAKRVDRKSEEAPSLQMNRFSLGFMGILEDAAAWAHESGRERVTEHDLVRVVRWRAELQESASVRWAIRQLAQPGGEHLFDAGGTLRDRVFTRRLWRLLEKGMRLSCRAGLPFLGTPHLIAAFCSTRDSVVWRAAELNGVDPSRLREELLRIVGNRQPAQDEFSLGRRTLTPRLIRMLVFAGEQADGEGRRVTEQDIVEAFLEDGGSSLELVRALGVEQQLRELLGEPRVRQRERSRWIGPAAAEEPDEESGTPTLDLLGQDLSAEAEAGTLPTILGREEELQRILNVLMRSEQRNPLLTGEPGVGKTALAAALAQRIHEGRVPARLKNLRVVEINGAGLLGGTSYRGELEARIKALLKEAEEDVILFIDEAHAVFSPRSAAGQPAEVPNHFKSALASGRIAVVAATTDAEFHRWIEQDSALKRRFERIAIPEVSPVTARSILQSLAPSWEADYEVPISPEALDAAIALSTRFIPEQSLPDKAKKLLMDSTIAVASELALDPGSDEPGRADLDGTPKRRVVSKLDVARQVSAKTGIPLDRIIRGSVAWWKDLPERLRDQVVGQGAAVEAVSRCLVAGRLNAVGRHRPQGVFVFAGPPGVGKSRLAKALANEVFGSPDALLRLDMSDYHEAHSISRLIGTPPGYVGYQDEDALVTPLRRRPSSVVFLDGFNLAHPRVQERLIRLLDEGEITDTRGLRADATHAIFILSVHVEVDTVSRIGFGGDAQHAERGLADFDAELAERLRGYTYEFVPFRGVTADDGGLAMQLFEERLSSFRVALEEEFAVRIQLDEAAWTRMQREVSRLQRARDIDAYFKENVVDIVSARLLAGIDEDVIHIHTPEQEPA